MKIILAQSAGFCFGVKRATQMAFEAAGKYPRLSSLGPIIHSPQLVKKLEEEGVEVVQEVKDLPESPVIIRSHGVTRGEFDGIINRGLKIVDATCPFVKKAQEYAALLSSEGYTVIIVGEEEHPEVQGIVSYARDGKVFVVADREQAESLPRMNKVGVVAQTTQSLENLHHIVETCLRKSKELRVFNTICDATSLRQEEARSIAREADVMIVIGGFNSANTNRLARICRDIQPDTHHVETAEEIKPSWFENVESVGVTAGASTPMWIIEDVLEKLTAIGTDGK